MGGEAVTKRLAQTIHFRMNRAAGRSLIRRTVGGLRGVGRVR
jgi:hypothetical protein